jgi:DNA modification methylase
VERLLGGARASMALTDPPYNVAYGNHSGALKTGRRRAIQNDGPGQGFYDFLLKACQNLLSVTDGAVYICMSSSELHTLQRAFVDAGGHWSTFIIWAKDTFTLGRSDYQRQYEPILYGWREGVRHHWCGDRDQGDVWSFPKPLASPLHPTMKPVPLVQQAVEDSSQPGDVVLDLFLGSGSTLIGCEHTGRVCYGLELEPEYVDVAVMRWEAFTGKKARKKRQ